MGNIVSIQFNKNEKPLYKSIAGAIEEQIKKNIIKSGSRLPPVRNLANQYGVNISTVVAAYRLLEENGLVYTKKGSGTYCMPSTAHPKDNSTEEDVLFPNDEYGNGKLVVSDDMINLAGNSPTAGVFPVGDFKNAVNEVLDTDGGYAFSYQESEGYRALREILCEFSKINYGINCSAEEILITSGAQQALDIISKAVIRQGDTVMAELPSYTGIKSVFAIHGAKMLGIPVQNDGIDLDITEYYAKNCKPKLIYSMPVYQTPTGVCLSKEKRRRLLELAEKYDFYIVEDDLFSDLNLTGERLLPLKQEDSADRVIYVKSFSKLMMPGIRAGYVIAPKRLFEKMKNAKYATDLSGSGFIQRALAVYFKNGCWNKNISDLVEYYRQRLDLTLKTINSFKRYGIRHAEVNGGFGVWLTLPDSVTDMDIYYKCRQKNVIIAPGSSFYLTPAAGFEHHLRLSFASSDRLPEGLKIAGECIKSAVNEKSTHTIFI
ncbi:MAG TPA: PLP-dependent aminotransferase family protein [Ruminiclostridium sp.]|nr:PLP-dependent aminotransferase family protein [Ruminiclostridium sp.]